MVDTAAASTTQANDPVPTRSSRNVDEAVSSTHLDNKAVRGPRGQPRVSAAGGVSAEVESPIGAYLWWCGHVEADAYDLDALQEWDYLHADEMTDAERRTLTAWALAAGVFGVPGTAQHPQR